MHIQQVREGHQGRDARAAGASPLRQGRERTGRNEIERRAVYRVQREVASMPASLVVQLAMWPDEIAAWARGEGSSESVVYNMLAGRKPYVRIREALAARLDVSLGLLAHLIEAARPLPLSKRPLDGAGAPGSAMPPIDWGAPPYPGYREGTNPIERAAVRRVELEIASMPASAVVGLAMWPETLAAWSRTHRIKASVVSATLAGSPSERIRAELARRLDVSRDALDDLIAGRRREPRSILPLAPPEEPPPEPPPFALEPPPAGPDPVPAAGTAAPAPAMRERPRRAGGGQMSLDL